MTTQKPIPHGNPYDMRAEAAGREIWDWQVEWRARHSLDHAGYLWACMSVLVAEVTGWHMLTPTDPEHPYDAGLEAAGRELFTFVNDLRTRHSLTRIQYLWIVNRLIAEELRVASLEEVQALDKQNEGYGQSSGEKKP